MHESRQVALQNFVDWCGKHITGDEKGQAQIFLDRLFVAFGRKGSLDVGGTAEMRIKKSKEDGGGTSFADYVWRPVVLIEMKKRGTDLARHYRQAFDYWTQIVPGRPQYVVLCNFDEFRIYDFNTQLDAPKDTVRLTDLPQRYGPLAFLFPTNEKPHFDNDREAVTREAADYLAECFHKLVARKVDRNLAQRFILQTLLALFAEDIRLLEKYTVTRLLEDIKEPGDVYDLFGGLFQAMNTEGITPGGRFKGVPYFNGGLFREPARLAELYDDEKNQLLAASRMDWSKVSPEIFGELFQKSMDAEHRHAFGAHFTYPSDIMKIVKPTIVDPWTAAIESAKSGKRLGELQDRLSRLRVLDPACGSGNFLYLAYREMKRLESLIRERLTAEFPDTQPRLTHVNARQFFGLDINDFAIELAKVTMTIARKLAIDELHIVDEPALPLDNLDANFQARDALIDQLGNVAPWPEADVIIGNPPFLGAKRLKPEHGADYVNKVRKAYPDVPGMADFCVYWIRRAADHLPPCTKEDSLVGRAGLVGTQNIRNNQSRVGGLDRVVETGTIVEAVGNLPWSGDANVHVSIVDWVKTKDEKLVPSRRRLWSVPAPSATKRKGKASKSGAVFTLPDLLLREVATISSDLSDDVDVSTRIPLECNQVPKRTFQGKILGYEGFLLDEQDARRLRGDSADVVVPLLTGREMLDDFRIKRWVIDFGNRSMAEAAAYPSAFEHCRLHVLPAVEASVRGSESNGTDMVAARREHLGRWWQFWNRRDELTSVLGKLSRYIACSRVTRRPIMVFVDSGICPSDALQVFGLEDDYSFGVLQSALHIEWFRKSSRLKVESDLRYSSRAIFETFPWPQHPTKAQTLAVAATAREVRRIRQEMMTQLRGGLRDVYRLLDLPGANKLKDAHNALDNAVMSAFGFSIGADSLAQLLALNHEVSARASRRENVVGPGAPLAVSQDDGISSDDRFVVADE